MTAGELRRLVLLSQQLTENVMSAALCAKDFGTIVRAESDRRGDGEGDDNGKGAE